MHYNYIYFQFAHKSNVPTDVYWYKQRVIQEEDEKERLSQAQEAGEDDGADHTEAAEDSFLGLSIEEVQNSQK